MRLSSKAREPLWCVEEVERVPGRRGVDDDEVEAAFLVQLVQLLHRHVFLRAAERARDVAIEAVVENALRLLGIGGVLGDEVVERRLRVEHQCVQLAVGRDTGIARPATAPGRSRSAGS